MGLNQQQRAKVQNVRAGQLMEILGLLGQAAQVRAMVAQRQPIIRIRNGIERPVSEMEAIADATELEERAATLFDDVVVVLAADIADRVGKGQLRVLRGEGGRIELTDKPLLEA